jgi:hypothetical protein
MGHQTNAPRGNHGVGRMNLSDRGEVALSAVNRRSGVRGFSSFSKGTRGKFLRGVSSLTPHSSISAPGS